MDVEEDCEGNNPGHGHSFEANKISSDVHVYYFQENKEQAKYAHELWERIRRECMYTQSFSRAMPVAWR